MTAKTAPAAPTRTLREIALEVWNDWPAARNAGTWDSQLGMYVGEHPAHPYLLAMLTLESMTDRFHEDGARSVVAYFLSNATGWRGETARRIKAELKAAQEWAAAQGVRW